MKMKGILILGICISMFFLSCKKTENGNTTESYAGQAHLDSLINGYIDYGNKEINEASINLLNFQKKYKTGATNGVVIPKLLLTQAINGYSASGINLPSDTTNFNKWDFLVVYPGLAINPQGEENPTTCVFYYKGTLDAKGVLIPTGNPVKTISLMGGGGSGGETTKTTPPPTLP